MSMYGANPRAVERTRSVDEATEVGDRRSHQPRSVRPLAGTVWEGPARQQFESEWNTTFRSAAQQAQRGVRGCRIGLHQPQCGPTAGDGCPLTITARRPGLSTRPRARRRWIVRYSGIFVCCCSS